MQIAPLVYFYPFTSPTDNNCNTIILDGPEKVIIDPGHKRYWPVLKSKIEADGLRPEDIKLALFTHCHPDHMEAGEILEFDYGTELGMSAQEVDFLNGPGREIFPWMGLDYPKCFISRSLKEEPLDLGDKTINLYLSPGHSPGSLCFHWPEAKVLITGDVLFAHSVGRSNLPGGDSDTLAKSITRLSTLNDVDMVLPGHGPAVIGAERVAANFEVVKVLF